MADDTDLELLSLCAQSDMVRVRPVLDKIADTWTIMDVAGFDPNLLKEFDALYAERHVTRAGHRIGLSQRQ